MGEPCDGEAEVGGALRRAPLLLSPVYTGHLCEIVLG